MKLPDIRITKNYLRVNYKLFSITLTLILFAILAGGCDELVPVVTITPTGVQVTPSPTVKLTNTKPIPSRTSMVTPQPIRRVELDPEDLRGTIIEYWHIWSGTTGEVMQDLVDEFNLNNEWGILVVPVYKGTLDQTGNAIIDALEVGEPPDLAVGYFHQVLEWDASIQ
jgi:hypothetical protein